MRNMRTSSAWSRRKLLGIGVVAVTALAGCGRQQSPAAQNQAQDSPTGTAQSADGEGKATKSTDTGQKKTSSQQTTADQQTTAGQETETKQWTTPEPRNDSSHKSASSGTPSDHNSATEDGTDSNTKTPPMHGSNPAQEPETTPSVNGSICRTPTAQSTEIADNGNE